MSNRARTRQRPGGDPGSRPFPTLLVVVVAAVVVVGIGLLIALSGGGDDDDGDGGSSAAAVFGPVRVEGDLLPEFQQTSGDEAVGRIAPHLELNTPSGAGASVGRGEPSLVVFLAHWCPHCQAEVPVLVDMSEDGAFDDIRLVGVLTGSNRDAPNFPPAAWLEREEWPGDVVLDDDEGTAAEAYGLAGYPFLVALDADGRVVGRTSGEQPPEVVAALVEAAGG